MGFESAGFRTAYAGDNNPDCKTTYDLNFKAPSLDLSDIRELSSRPQDMPDFDVLLAGFPCQAFSIAGHRKGFEDTDRGSLFFNLLDILRYKRPVAFFLENVKHLQAHDGGRTFRVISEDLESVGYFIKAHVLNSAEHGGVPQRRERVYIVGFRSAVARDAFEFPEETPLLKRASDFLDRQAGPEYYYEGKPLYRKIGRQVAGDGTFYQWRRVYLRASREGVCPTLTANMGGGGHNVPIIRDRKGVRRLTPRECARLQGFPESFRFPEGVPDYKLYQQIGNSVTVPVVERIALSMKKALRGAPLAPFRQRMPEAGLELARG